MRRQSITFAVATLLTLCEFAGSSEPGQPRQLFDGKSLAGWTTFDGKPIKPGGWTVEDGMLHRTKRSGHIYFEEEVADFELSFEWKLSKGGNSGVKYRVRKYGKRILGCEYQIYDDRGNEHTKSATGSLYALYAANKQKQLNPPGGWNNSKIVVDGNRIEHWLNGKKIVNAIAGSDDWNSRVKKSKFAPYQSFSQNRLGRIMLQDHGKEVWFRNIVLVPIIDESISKETAAAAKAVSQIIAHRGASLERPECTMSAIQRAIEVKATAVEVDVRTAKDGALFVLHDATLDRTTNCNGPANEKTLAELKQLDAGSWFDAKFKDQRIPSLPDAVRACKDKVDVLLDLKEQGDEYDRKVIGVIRKHGSPKGTIIGVRSVEQAKRFRKLLPEARQLGLIPNPESIEAFAGAGVETIRLWPKWLAADGVGLVDRVRKADAKLHLNGTTGERGEVLDLVKHQPDSMSSDDPNQLITTLKLLAQRAGP